MIERACLQCPKQPVAITDQYFEDYQVWRETYMGRKDKFTPDIEDLWIMHLIFLNCDIVSNDMPDFVNYLVDKTIEARRDNPNADIEGFIRKEYTRWHNIIQIQFTSFQGLAAGKPPTAKGSGAWIAGSK